MDELDDLRAAAQRATDYEQSIGRLVAKAAAPGDAKLLARMSALDQMDWLKAHTAPAALTPPPVKLPPDPLAIALAQKRREYRGSF